jgi:hypothetical protein
MSTTLQEAIQTKLEDWRDDELIDIIYPGTTTISGATLLGNDVIQKLATCGVRIETKEHLQQQTRWYLAFDEQAGSLTAIGEQLLKHLHGVYEEYDQKMAAVAGDVTYAPNLPSNPSTIPPALFYGEQQQISQQGGRSRVRGQVRRGQQGQGEQAVRGSERRRGRARNARV